MASVAHVYAKAFFELGNEKKQLDAAVNELRAFQDTLSSSKALTAILAGAGIDAGKQKAILGDVIQAAGITGLPKSLLELLSARSRLAALPAILAELARMVETSQGVVAGTVSSAVELGPEDKSVLEKSLGKRIGKTVRLSAKVNPALLGGVVVKVDGKTFDASLRSQLDRFKNELI